jgi:hypothetical protein
MKTAGSTLAGGGGTGNPFKRSSEQSSTYTFVKATPFGVEPEFTIELVRVSTILGCLAKPALIGWTEKLVLEGIAALISEGVALESLEGVKQALKDRGLRRYDLMTEASNRGTRCHAYLEKALEGFGPPPRGKTRPTPAAVVGAMPPPQDDYQRSVADWIVQVAVEGMQVAATEKGLVNLREGYAGRADLIVGRYPWTFDPDRGDGVIDLKTRKEEGIPYESEFLQLGAYWGAYLSMTGRKLQHTGVLLARPGQPATIFEGNPQVDYEAFLQLAAVFHWLDARS